MGCNATGKVENTGKGLWSTILRGCKFKDKCTSCNGYKLQRYDGTAYQTLYALTYSIACNDAGMAGLDKDAFYSGMPRKRRRLSSRQFPPFKRLVAEIERASKKNSD